MSRILLATSILLFACTANTDGDDSDTASETDTDVGLECETQNIATPIETFTSEVEDGSPFLYTKAPEARALLLIFHGGGGDKEDNLHLRIDPVLIAREAHARGYALASLDSAKHLEENPSNSQWSKIMNINPEIGEVNPDVINALEMIQRLRGKSDLAAVPSDTPIVVMGFSNGGSMASRLAQFTHVSASATYISNSVEYLDGGSIRPPMVLVPGENDLDHQASESNAELAAQIEANGGNVLLINNPAQPISPGLFQRVPGIKCEVSREFYVALIEGGWLASDGRLSRNPKADRSWSEVLPVEAQEFEDGITDVLYEAYAEHAPSSDWNSEVFGYIDSYVE